MDRHGEGGQSQQKVKVEDQEKTYQFARNIQVGVGDIDNVDIDEESWAGEYLGMGLGDGLGDLILLVPGQLAHVLNIVERHFEIWFGVLIEVSERDLEIGY